MAWPSWDKERNLPDLSPLHTSSLFKTPRLALEYETEFFMDKKGIEINGVEGVGLAGLVHLAFHDVDGEALKVLNKVFKTLVQEYFTLEFIDPEGRCATACLYADPVFGRKVIDLYEELRSKNRKSSKDPAAVPLSSAPSEKTNCCVVMPPEFNLPICSAGEECQNKCKFYKSPDLSKEGEVQFPCYWQENNEQARDIEDMRVCCCEEAVGDLEATLQNT